MINKQNLAKLNHLFNKINKINKSLKLDVPFDMASLKNIKHNMKITKDTSYLHNFLLRNTNLVALKEILKASYDISKSSYIEIHTILKTINKDDANKENIKLLEKAYKLFNDSLYLILDEINYETSKANNDKENFKLNYSNLEMALINYGTQTLDLENDLEKLINNLMSLANATYLKDKEINNKFVKWFKTKFDARFRKLKPTIAPDKMHFKDLFKKENLTKDVLKTYFFGNDEHKGFVTTFIIYFLLILFGFVYVYPILYMLGYSFMSTSDLVNPNVNYVPTQLETQNYIDAAETLNYWSSLGQTLLVSVLPAICQTIACSLIAWGLARYQFKGKKILFGLVIFTFLIPSCLTMLPTVSLYAKFGITGNVLAYILPALFGQGIKSAVFILIFYQYFKALPKAIIEAAQIDGANDFVVFIRIALPAARSGILLTILLSIVWYYNETVLASLFFGSNIQTLPLGLENFKASFDAILGGDSSGKSINEAIYMAGTMLNILPLLLLYFFTQKYFIQGVDKAGITGE